MFGAATTSSCCEISSWQGCLFNAIRGGEPCRLLWNEWRDAEKGVWVDNSAASALLDPVERQLVSNDLIAYQAAKGANMRCQPLSQRTPSKA